MGKRRTTSWKTTLGGALTATGHTLMGVGVIPQLAGAQSKALLYIALAGFILVAAGTFVTGLFAADHSQIQRPPGP
jgi:TRAP-type C4-dicarboxylate transport system permease small subunit